MTTSVMTDLMFAPLLDSDVFSTAKSPIRSASDPALGRGRPRRALSTPNGSGLGLSMRDTNSPHSPFQSPAKHKQVQFGDTPAKAFKPERTAAATPPTGFFGSPKRRTASCGNLADLLSAENQFEKVSPPLLPLASAYAPPPPHVACRCSR